MKLAVIVTTYNRPDALAAVLEGYLAQSETDFELIVADDGSTADTAKVVRDFAERAPFAIRHVWQEDVGFRAAAIRNQALVATDAPYVVFTDGDCVPVQRFVARHRVLAQAGWFLSANRVLLSEAFTREVLRRHIPIQDWNAFDWTLARARGEINRLLPLLSLPDGGLRRRHPQQWEGVKTCNLSAWRADLVRVNGLDEAYSGWGLEDSDLVIRLLRAGVKHKSARFAAPVFHLWHPENDRRHLPENRRRLDQVLRSQDIRALQGLDRYPPVAPLPASSEAVSARAGLPGSL